MPTPKQTESRFSKTSCLSIMLIAGHGIEGDAHFGPFMRHRYLARRNPRAPNLRQVHPIPAELLQGSEVAGYGVEPGGLGKNITTVGINLEGLPLDTELRIGDATIHLTGLRTPCVLIDRQTRAESASDYSGFGPTVSGRRDGHRDREWSGRTGRRHQGDLACDTSARASGHLKAL